VPGTKQKFTRSLRVTNINYLEASKLLVFHNNLYENSGIVFLGTEIVNVIDILCIIFFNLLMNHSYLNFFKKYITDLNTHIHCMHILSLWEHLSLQTSRCWWACRLVVKIASLILKIDLKKIWALVLSYLEFGWTFSWPFIFEVDVLLTWLAYIPYLLPTVKLIFFSILCRFPNFITSSKQITKVQFTPRSYRESTATQQRRVGMGLSHRGLTSSLSQPTEKVHRLDKRAYYMQPQNSVLISKPDSLELRGGARKAAQPGHN
jgi:hypothetical protein